MQKDTIHVESGEIPLLLSWKSYINLICEASSFSTDTGYSAMKNLYWHDEVEELGGRAPIAGIITK